MVKRPIVNTRDEPHADREKYRRLHVIVGDSNMSEYTIYLRNGVTALILSMIEDGAITRDLTLRDPVRAIKEVSHDPTLQHELQLETASRTDGRARSRASSWRWPWPTLRRVASTRIQKDVLQKWEYVTGVPRARSRWSSTREIDWVIKKRLIESFMERKELDWDDSQVQMLDLQYHDSRPDKGLYYMLERQGKVERIVTDEEITRGRSHSRPRTRGPTSAANACSRYPSEVFGVNWDSISFGFDDEPIKRVMMAEPLKGTERIRRGAARSVRETAAELLTNMES